MEDKKTIKVSTLLIGVIVVLVAIIIVGAFAFMKMRNQDQKEDTAAVQKIGMEAGVVTNEDSFNVELKEPFTFTTLYKRDIYITNGRSATCYIGNSDGNYYEDMYIQIYLNDEEDQPKMDEAIYVSQIIPRGSHIESFEANMDLEPGDYRGTLVHSTVNEEGELVGDTPVIVDIHVAG